MPKRLVFSTNGCLSRNVITPTESGDRISTTLRGRSLYERLCDETGEISRQIYAGLDPDDLAATHRVLSVITARANSLLDMT